MVCVFLLFQVTHTPYRSWRRFAEESFMSTNAESHFLRVYGSTFASGILDMIQVLPRLSHKRRKCLLTVTRARTFPVAGTSLYSQTWEYLSPLFTDPNLRQQMLTILSSPMLSGYFLSALMSAPYTPEEVHVIKHTLLWKEVTVMESMSRTPTVNWHNLYTYGDPIHTDFRPSPKLNRLVQRALYRWSLKCEKKILYPYCSNNKGTSSSTRDSFERTFGVIEEDCEVTSGMLEHYYSRTGIKVEGICELKQRWYPTQASPRTYFAQGGLAYHSSKFVRDAFNWVCDELWSTNRYNRVSISGLAVSKDEDVFIYDLTSFTSLFHEHRAFLTFLAQAMEEVSVVVFDSWYGPLHYSLGKLIWEYLCQNV